MNFSTHFNPGLTRSTLRQSTFTLTFFCFAILLFILTSCSENIFQSPYGNRSLSIDTLHYDNRIITEIKNINADASGSMLSENKAGEYHALNAEFLIKFTNFLALRSLPDTVELRIDNADIVLYPSNSWGVNSTFSLDFDLVDTDTSLYWENISDPDEVFNTLEGKTQYYSTAVIDPSADSVRIPIETETVEDWYRQSDADYSNNGLIVRKNAGSEGMAAFYSIDYLDPGSDKRPYLLLECSLYDTNDIYLKDSIFHIAGSGDIQKTESDTDIDDSRFFLSQGNIFRSYIMMDSLRRDTLLGPSRLINKAEQRFVIKPNYSKIAPGDTLYLTARLFKTDSWEEDSLRYMFTTRSNVFSGADDTIRLDISRLLQYMVSNEKETTYEGIFFYLNNEYNDFNYITIDPDHSSLDLIYTKVNDE
ncbi:MAG: hypothetical protein R6V48_07775 [Fidelibacterota bacterium]